MIAAGSCWHRSDAQADRGAHAKSGYLIAQRQRDTGRMRAGLA